MNGGRFEQMEDYLVVVRNWTDMMSADMTLVVKRLELSSDAYIRVGTTLRRVI
jgi:hypothetical protein